MAKEFTLIGPKRQDDGKPLWEAALQVEEEVYDKGPLEGKAGNQARAVFLDLTPQPSSSRLQPAVVRACCRIQRLTIHPPIAKLVAGRPLVVSWESRPPGDTSSFPPHIPPGPHPVPVPVHWKQPDDEVLPTVPLMLQPLADFKTAYLHHGDLPLDSVWHAEQWQAQPLTQRLNLPGFDGIELLRLNADGFSFVASISLPWRTQKLRARFQLSCPFDKVGKGQSVYRVELDRRDPAPGVESSADPGALRRRVLGGFTAAFDELRALLPKIDDKGDIHPLWQSLELSAEAIPDFHWRIEQGKSVLHLGSNALALHLADGPPPTEPEHQRERSVATLRPEWTVHGDGSSKLEIAVFTLAVAKDSRITWEWQKGKAETITLADVALSDDPLDTARWARQAQDITRPIPLTESTVTDPEKRRKPERPPVLTVHTPLSDGWAQWPVPNVIQEDYELKHSQPELQHGQPPSGAQPLIAGTVLYEHVPSIEVDVEAQQNPWSLTVLQGQELAGPSRWSFSKVAVDETWTLEAATTCVLKPVLVFDGLLWLSAEPPRVQDALPDLADHLRHLRAIPLRTDESMAKTPSALRLTLEPCVIQRSQLQQQVIPELQAALLKVAMNHEFKQRAVAWSLDFGQVDVPVPLLARHHPTLPCITSLPFWQTQDPPTHPAASRQLMMLRPKHWKPKLVDGWLHQPWLLRFSGLGWPATETEIAIACEWAASRLPMAVVSVPGLTFDPRHGLGLPASKPFGAGSTAPRLSTQYWHGLPVVDQPNAFSQRPKQEEADGDDPIHLGVPKPKPAPLSRDRIGTWLTDLADKQYRARTEAAECWVDKSGALSVEGLVEPLHWPVKVTVDETAYPGTVLLEDVTTGLQLMLRTTEALRGLHGGFDILGGELRLADLDPSDTSAAVQIIAGSMAARADSGHLMDQRGLGRKAASLDVGTGDVNTPLQLLGVDLVQRTLTRPLILTGADDEWQFMAAGVPLEQGVFKRDSTRSSGAEDANDPGARGAAWNARAGYHWWLGAPGTKEPARLKFRGLDVFPLALDFLSFAGGQVELRLLARLQLPVKRPDERLLEQTQRANAVLMTFKGTRDNLLLSAVEPAPVPLGERRSPAGQWPFTADESGPQLEWDMVRLDGADNLILEQARLKFALFGQNWSVKLDPIAIAPGGPLNVSLSQGIGHAVPGMTIQEVKVRLAADGAHRLEIILALQFGEQSPLEIGRGYLVFSTDPKDLPAVMTGRLASPGGTLPLVATGGATEGLGIQAVLSAGELQADMHLQVFPGMSLDEGSLKQEVTGFAAMSFTADDVVSWQGHELPKLEVSAAAAELVLPARWGASLQDAGARPSSGSVHDACAGDVFANFSTEMHHGRWSDKVLLNGWLEIKNLISWPASLLDEAVEPQTFCLTFATGETSLSENGKLRADAQQAFTEVMALLKTGRYLLRFEGHADDTDSMTTNLGVSENRADKARREFERFLPSGDAALKKFIEKSRYYGEHRLKVLAYDEASRTQNRRVELVLRPASLRIPAHDESPDHCRHTIRVLLHQHEVLHPALGEKGSGAIFTLRSAWQALAVTQHELTRLSGSQPDEQAIQDRLRWTAAQEVRLVPAALLADRLAEIAASEVADPISEKKKPVSEVFHWSLRSTWLTGAKGREELAKLAPGLVVEASSALWMRVAHSAPQTPTVLQYLPTGTQSGTLLTPEELGDAEQGARPWIFLCMPFLGRLQNPFFAKTNPSVLANDPVLTLRDQGAKTPPVVLGLVSRHTKEAWACLAAFDSAPEHRFERLSEGALQAALLRCHHPAMESGTDPAAFAAVMQALPENSPGRATRPTALAAAFDASRLNLLSSETGSSAPPPDPSDIEWRKEAWLGQQAALVLLDRLPKPGGTPAKDITAKLPHSFLLPPLLIKAAWKDKGRLIAVTALPAATGDVANNNLPVTLAVSPCTSLAFTRTDFTKDTLLVAFGEMLAVDVSKRRLTSLLSTVWIDPKAEDMEVLATTWAAEAASQLAPESALLVVRLRETVKATDGICVRYRHWVAKPSAIAPLPPPGRALRARPALLHFADTQFAGHHLPDTPRAFELAPPLTAGVQPLWSESFVSEQNSPTRPSALRVAVQTLNCSGPAVVGAASADPERRWWQALWHHAAFDSSDSSRHLLPPKFRAPARIGYAAEPTQLAVPVPADLASVLDPSPQEKEPWQPMLPAAFDAVIVGARAAVPLVMRPVTITTLSADNSSESPLYQSASVPSQHRFPRPVSLPANREQPPGKEHQPWASLAHPTDNHLPETGKFQDIAVFALPDRPVFSRIALAAIVQARQADKPTDEVQETHHRAGLLIQGQPLLGFDLILEEVTEEMRGSLIFTLGDSNTQFGLTFQTKPVLNPNRIVPSEGTAEALHAWLGKLPHGTNLDLIVKVPAPETKVRGYEQTLQLPVRVGSANRMRASLDHHVIHFEDPAYNRVLASPTVQRSGMIPDTTATMQTMLLAADRREYNRDSTLIGVLADTAQSTPTFPDLNLWVNLVSRERGDQLLPLRHAAPGPEAASLSRRLTNRKIFRVDLAKLTSSDGTPLQLLPRDVLVLHAGTRMASEDKPERFIEIRVEIVARDIIPPPEYGYALLSAQGPADLPKQFVRCARFAWNPAATRIELLNPDDLLGPIAHRRAVFRWIDSCHSGHNVTYAIQKITPVGATHWPL